MPFLDSLPTTGVVTLPSCTQHDPDLFSCHYPGIFLFFPREQSGGFALRAPAAGLVPSSLVRWASTHLCISAGRRGKKGRMTGGQELRLELPCLLPSIFCYSPCLSFYALPYLSPTENNKATTFSLLFLAAYSAPPYHSSIKLTMTSSNSLTQYSPSLPNPACNLPSLQYLTWLIFYFPTPLFPGRKEELGWWYYSVENWEGTRGSTRRGGGISWYSRHA